MRSRTLMRPMFRIGGSAGIGITSGLIDQDINEAVEPMLDFLFKDQ